MDSECKLSSESRFPIPDGRDHSLLVFRERRCGVRLPDTILTEMLRWGRADFPNGTGGTLVGHYSEDLSTAVIERALLARGARRGRTGPPVPPTTLTASWPRYTPLRGERRTTLEIGTPTPPARQNLALAI